MNTLQYELELDDLRSDGVSVPRPFGVLVVIADPRSRADTADDLSREGFNVWTAGSGVDALSTYVEHAGQVDVLLLDANLTDLPGSAFLTRFRKYFPGVPCVFLTGRSDAVADALAGVEASVLRRPITPAVLAVRLVEAVALGTWVAES